MSDGRREDFRVPLIVSDQGKPVGVAQGATVGYQTDKVVQILYTNWKGVTAWRRIVPDRIWFGQTNFHPDVTQWMLHALDVDKGEERDFAVKDIHDYKIGVEK